MDRSFSISCFFSCFAFLQLPQITLDRRIKKAKELGILDTIQVVEFKEEGIVKNDDKTIAYKDVLAILITSGGSEWTFIDKGTLEAEDRIKEFEKFLEERCRQARWTQVG